MRSVLKSLFGVTDTPRPVAAPDGYVTPAKPAGVPVKHADLIYDIGMHSGVDTRRYLAMGYRVVGLDANPVLTDKCKIEFADDIAAGRLTIVNAGIAKQAGRLTFYRNLYYDEWSSFLPHLGQREGKFDTIEVDCITIHDLIARHGVPHFLKIDVEGFDEIVAMEVGKSAVRPDYMSIEDGGIHTMVSMCNAGLTQFKFVNQPEAQKTTGVASSGPFGEDIEGPWMTMHEAFLYYCTSVRPPNSMPFNGWWDIHGKY